MSPGRTAGNNTRVELARRSTMATQAFRQPGTSTQPAARPTACCAPEGRSRPCSCDRRGPRWPASSCVGRSSRPAIRPSGGGGLVRPLAPLYVTKLGEGYTGFLVSTDLYGHKGTDFLAREVDGSTDLMGAGMGLRAFYFDKWKNHLNSKYNNWFCGCDYQVK